MHAFCSHALSFGSNPFEELQAAVRFEALAKGRQGAVLVKPDDKRGTPIVRTTSKYKSPAQIFHPSHHRLAEQIREQASLQDVFNNALIESYDNSYFKMGAHSDLALDLKEETSIALFTCYQHPKSAAPKRRLVVTSKEAPQDTFEIPLLHQNVVVFSLENNRRFKHKIVLDVSKAPPENRWLGVTFRTSKTFVHQRRGQTFFEDGRPLSLATELEESAFYKHRGKENRETDFSYPEISYTLSQSDQEPPTNHNPQ